MAALGLLEGCLAVGGRTDPARDDPFPTTTGTPDDSAPDARFPEGGDGAAEAGGAIHISGVLSGLWGPCQATTCENSLLLQDNGGDDLTLRENGVFTFTTLLSGGEHYAVTVRSQPVTKPGFNGGQTCIVSAGDGDAGSQDVTDVLVNCVTNSYTLGGTVSGLPAGEGLLLSSFAYTGTAPEGADNFVVEQTLGIAGDGSPLQTFTFQTPVVASSYYSVRIGGEPQPSVGRSCALTGANAKGLVAGAIADANITNLEVVCTTISARRAAKPRFPRAASLRR